MHVVGRQQKNLFYVDASFYGYEALIKVSC
nr:MAG TPA: hypothetical protein [Caudoviricetes sp.]